MNNIYNHTINFINTNPAIANLPDEVKQELIHLAELQAEEVECQRSERKVWFDHSFYLTELLNKSRQETSDAQDQIADLRSEVKTLKAQLEEK